MPEAGCDVTVTVELDSVPRTLEPQPARTFPVRKQAGWYRGDLHCHTYHSDAKGSPELLHQAAKQAGLDFLAIADHNTITHRRYFHPRSSPDLVFVRAMEVTTAVGHANVYGVDEWIDFRMTKPSDAHTLARLVHEKGGLLSINHDKLTKDHLVISNASCTTNCLAPVAKVLNDAIGIEKGFMTTIHSYTNDQPSLDQMHKDLYRARAAALSMIPTSTGAAKAVGLVLPELNGKLDGVSIRVPTPNVSVVDLKFVAKKKTTVEEINKAVSDAAKQKLKGVLAVTAHPNVSIDFNHDPHSSTMALDQTKVMDGTFCSVLSWYDNEWGFSNRMSDTAVAMAKTL